MRAVILSGSGRYSDRWHRFDETSAALAGIVAGAGYHVDVNDDVLGGLAALDGIDLLVVNAGDPDMPNADDAIDAAAPEAADLTAATDGFDAALERGI
ncbi:MAG TPA: hypothetical protein VF000_02095, partial [Agromyces sp.]